MSDTWVDKIYAYIHEDIVSLRLKPGQRLHIADLAKQYGIGPGPVREALSRLSSTELVNTVSQKGFRVTPISRADLYDIYETRTQVEAIALSLAIEKGDDNWEADIISCYHLLSKYESEHGIQSANGYTEWEKRHRAFNLALIKACKLQHLLRIQEQLYKLTERYRRQWLLAGIKLTELSYAKSQKKIMDAVLSRDSPLAIKLLHQHFDNAVKVIDKFFTEHDLFSNEEG